MKQLLLSLLAVLATLTAGAKSKNSVGLEAAGNHVQVTFYTPSIVRVVKRPAGKAQSQKPSMVVTMQPQANFSVKVSERDGQVTMTSDRLTVSVSKQTGLVQFLDNGRNLLKEKATTFEKIARGADAGRYKVGMAYRLDDGEAIYGLGTVQDGKLNRRGLSKRIEQSNIEDFQNVIQSVKGWGLYWDNYSVAHFSDNAGGMSFKAEVGDCADYYMMYGGTADGVNACMRQLSGGVRMFPLWTFGFWQCRERYRTSQELLEVVDKYRSLQVPLDGIIQDWQYWGGNDMWNAMDFTRNGYADGKEMIERVHRQNAHIMFTIWSSFGPATRQNSELAAKGLLYPIETWPPNGYSKPGDKEYRAKVYDAFSSEARQVYWKYLKKLFGYGADAWWMDSTDPDFFNAKESDYEHMTAAGSWRSVRNAYPLVTVRGVYNNQRHTSDSKRVFIMTRSAFAGMQHYGAGLWSGDVQSTWDMLRKQVPAGLNYAMTGCPNFNTDIGGFFCGSYNIKGGTPAQHNPQYQELYVRWMQYGLFCPVFRSHGTNAPREIYQFGSKGEPIYDAIEQTIRLRYRLLPYIYSTAWQVTSGNGSYQRALVYDFSADRNTWDMGDEFMFGRSILATPILTAQYTKEEIVKEPVTGGLETRSPDGKAIDFTRAKSATKYLPKGADWYEFYTEQRHEGGRNVTFPTAIGRTAMFVRAGSILPLAPVMQYARQRAWDDLEVVVYPGADGSFTLYEDEGDNYNYEKGLYATVTMTWNDKARTLTIGKAKGQFPGMLKNRVFKVRKAGSRQVTTVSYDGRRKTCKL